MHNYHTSPISLKDIIKQSFQAWWPSLKLIWPLIVVPVLIRAHYCLSCLPLSEGTGEGFPGSIIILIGVFLSYITIWMLISAVIYRSFLSQEERLWQNLYPMFKQGPRFLAALFLYFLLIVLAGFFGNSLAGLVIQSASPNYNSPFVSFSSYLFFLPMIFVVVGLSFALPMLLIEKISIGKAFSNSLLITRKHWLKTSFAYVGVVIFLIFLRKIYVFLQMSMHGNSLVNTGIYLVFFLLLIPLFANFYTFILHDLRLRSI